VPPRNDKGLPAQLTELWELVVAYFKQEALEPIKDLGRYVKNGVIGSVLLCVGLPILVLAVLRAVQAETDDHLTGSWNWAPYGIAALLSAIFAGLAAWGISRKSKSKKKEARA
jgi:hypothetical protein